MAAADTKSQCCKSQSGPKVEAISDAMHLTKGPHWDSNTQSLYFVNMHRGTIHCYKPDTNKVTSAVVGCGDQPLAIIVPVEGKKDEFVVSLKNDLACITWDGVDIKTSQPKVIQNLEPNDNTNRINNGKVDPKGRLWAGTASRKLTEKEFIFEIGVSGLYVLNDASTVSKALGCITIANGMEWSLDKKKFYFADSYKYQLEVFDYDDEKGTISNPKPIFNLKDNNINGVLDAMAIDTDGKLYIANYNGCQVIVLDPETAKIVNQIKIPAKEVSSVCWGGPSKDILFVTTGNTEPTKCSEAGKVFKVTNLGAKGVPCRNVKL